MNDILDSFKNLSGTLSSEFGKVMEGAVDDVINGRDPDINGELDKSENKVRRNAEKIVDKKIPNIFKRKR